MQDSSGNTVYNLDSLREGQQLWHQLLLHACERRLLTQLLPCHERQLSQRKLLGQGRLEAAQRDRVRPGLQQWCGNI